MEIVLRLKVPNTIAVPWERVISGWLILIFFCVLYSCVKGYAVNYETEFDKMPVSKGIILPDYGKDVSDVYGSLKSISTKLCYLDKEKILGQSIDMNITGKQKISDAVLPRSNMNVSLGNNRQKQDLSPETEKIQEQEMIISDFFSESKETEQEVSFVREEESPGNVEDDMREIAGFSVDAQGYITGTTDNLILTDGILVIPSDEACVGIREKAFSDIGFGIDEVMEIFIPANIQDIEQGVFDNFVFLMYIEVGEDNPHYCSMDGILYTISGEEIVCPAGR